MPSLGIHEKCLGIARTSTIDRGCEPSLPVIALDLVFEGGGVFPLSFFFFPSIFFFISLASFRVPFRSLEVRQLMGCRAIM